ncbi:MarR family transcriptional regulator [Siculibacillus lacustris]|uniref:MarR family transcriptional regulator n=1 Tax=Siculibacillus lacustris TaxID=1549641 RepID=A0A4Q9VMN7_9HYPH|nr:MarR family winged helix-turn-helix transcriptional regulator [Siculibacillus lacustris]TBW36305.1 MarR family transcriptional regulator [Siculibacillus lacustris]
MIPPDRAEDTLGILVSDVARLFWRRLEAAFRDAGLDFTSGEARVLITLVERCDGGGSRQSRLAERLHIEPMTLVGHLDRLEARGLVERRPDADDRRAKIVRATEAGLSVAATIGTIAARVRAAMAADLDAQEVAALSSLLHRVRANLATSPAARGHAA